MRSLKFLISVAAISSPFYSFCSNSPVPFTHSSEGYNFELILPQYTGEGMFTTTGGVVWSEGLRLQARSIRQWSNPQGEMVLQASGDLMLFYNGYLLIGETLDYNLSKHEGVLYDGVLSSSGWYIGGSKVKLHADRAISLDKAWLSSDPQKDGGWKISASQVHISSKKHLKIKNISFRVLGIPLFYLPRMTTNQDRSARSAVEYAVVWKGQRKRKASVRYHFYKKADVNLWTRLDYHIGRGPGIGLDGRIGSGKNLYELANFASRDGSLLKSEMTTRYRFKGHYRRRLSSTAQFDLHYDRYSDYDVPSDYAFSEFDRRLAGKTRALIKQRKETFLHQLTYRVKINPFQTVKKELPSYYLTPHPIHFSSHKLIPKWLHLHSHWRAEYLTYDFRTRTDFSNYHSIRLLNHISGYTPFQLGPLCFNPCAGWKIVAYNQTPKKQSQLIFVPTATIHAQLSWLKPAACSHSLTAYSSAEYVGKPQKSMDEHYIFDYRDIIAEQALAKLGLKQRWYKKGQEIALVDIRAVQMLTNSTIGHSRGYGQVHGYYLIHPRWRVISCLELERYICKLRNFSFRSENSWTRKFSSVVEYRTRSESAWRKANGEDYSLETIRDKDYLLSSAMSDKRSALLIQLNYRLTPNWVIRLDTAHGWSRKHQDPYQQYCLGLGTDLGGNWRLQAQITKTPLDWDWRIRIDLRDGPVNAPGPRF